MTRSVKKRGRSTVQPRLTAFLQPAQTLPTLGNTACPLVTAEGSSKYKDFWSNEGRAACWPATVGGVDQHLHKSPQENSSKKRVTGPVSSCQETPDDAGASRQKLSGRNERWALGCNGSVSAVQLRDDDTNIGADGVGQSSNDWSTESCGIEEKAFSTKCSLEAFVKRQKVEPWRGPERNRKEGNASAGRAVNGSAYAQCPMCMVHIPLIRMNHHLDIECNQRCTKPTPICLPSSGPPVDRSRVKPPAKVSPGAHASTENQRGSSPVVETTNEHPKDSPFSADVRGGGVPELGRCCVDADSRGSDRGAAQVGTEVIDEVLHFERCAGRTGNGSEVGANRGVLRTEDEKGEGRKEIQTERLAEADEDFAVMPTLDAWLPEVSKDSQGLVHNEGGALQNGRGEERNGRTGALECGQHALRVTGCEAEKLGVGMRRSDCQVTEGQETNSSSLGQTEKPMALVLEQGRCNLTDAHMTTLAASKVVQSKETVSTTSRSISTENEGLGDCNPSSSQAQKGPVSDQRTGSCVQGGHTLSPSGKEPVNPLLGMIRERGQRPLFGLSWAAIQMRQPSAPKGHYLVENFLTEEEEAHILASLDADVSNPWLTSRVFGDVNEGKAYGLVTDLRKRTISKPKRPIPAFLQSVLARIRTVAPSLSNFVPNECNAINYRREEGHWLRAHVDDRQLSGTIIAGISLHSDCVMTYKKERGRPEKFRVRLPRRCLQVQTQDSRYNYTHSIKNADLRGERRVSITFRQVAEPLS